MPKIRAVFLYEGIWSDDSYDVVHSRYPAKELLALANPYAGVCHGVIGCEEDGGFAETVYDYPGLVRTTASVAVTSLPPNRPNMTASSSS